MKINSGSFPASGYLLMCGCLEIWGVFVSWDVPSRAQSRAQRFEGFRAFGSKVGIRKARAWLRVAGMDVDESGETSWMEFVEFISVRNPVLHYCGFGRIRPYNCAPRKFAPLGANLRRPFTGEDLRVGHSGLVLHDPHISGSLLS